MFNSPQQFFALLLGCLCLVIATVAPETSDNRAQKQGEAELLDLHKQERRAHFEHDANFFLAHIGYQLLDVRDGQVNRMSRGDVRAKFVEYFKNANFLAWDDVEPPIVRISTDGNTGSMIVRVRIVYTESDQSGKKTDQSTVGAWMSAYEKRNGTWVMTVVTSTFAEK